MHAFYNNTLPFPSISQKIWNTRTLMGQMFYSDANHPICIFTAAIQVATLPSFIMEMHFSGRPQAAAALFDVMEMSLQR